MKNVVVKISNKGIRLAANGDEFFLAYKDFPEFRRADSLDVYNFKLVGDSHLYWPDLDIDLSFDQLRNPKKYPLVYKKEKK